MNYYKHFALIFLLSLVSFTDAQDASDIDTDIATGTDSVTFDVSLSDTVNLGVKSSLYQKGIGLFKKGLQAYMNKDYEEAYEIFEKVIKLDPLHEECFMLLHRAKTKMGIVEVEKDIPIDSTQSAMQYQKELFKEGLTTFAENNFTKAKRSWNRLYNINPRYPHLKSYLRKVEKEITHLKRNKSLRNRTEQLFISGSEYYVNGNIASARTCLDSVLFFDPHHKNALSLLLKINEDILKQQSVQFRKGITRYSQGDYRNAIAIWEKALTIDSTNTTIKNYLQEAENQLHEIRKMHRNEGERHLSENKLKIALDEFEKIIRIFPEDTEVSEKVTAIRKRYQKEVKDTYKEAVNLFKQNEYKKASLLFENIIMVDPSFVAAKEYLQKCRENLASIEAEKIKNTFQEDALGLQQKEEWERAARKWEELIDIDSLNTDAHDGLRLCQSNLQKQRNSLELQKTFNRSVSLYQSGKITEAKVMWNQILSRDPDNEMVLQMMKKINDETARQLKRGKTFYKKQQWAQAITAYKKVLAMDPKNEKAKQSLTSAKQKRTQAKKTASAPPSKINPKVIEKLFNAGLDFYMAKKYKPALKEFSKIVALDPENARAKSYIKNLKNKLDRLKNL